MMKRLKKMKVPGEENIIYALTSPPTSLKNTDTDQRSKLGAPRLILPHSQVSFWVLNEFVFFSELTHCQNNINRQIIIQQCKKQGKNKTKE